MNKEAINKWVLLLLVFFISALFLSMISQFLMAIFLAGIFSALSYPLYQRFEKWFKGRRSLASITTLLIIVFVVLLPLGGLLGITAGQAIKVGEAVKPWVERQLAEPDAISDALKSLPFYDRIIPYRSLILKKAGEMVGGISGFLINRLSSVTLGTVNFLFMLFIMLYTMFFFLMDGNKLIDKILYYLPLEDHDERRILNKFTSVTRATLKGTAVIGILQGVGILGRHYGGVVLYSRYWLRPGVGTGGHHFSCHRACCQGRRAGDFLCGGGRQHRQFAASHSGRKRHPDARADDSFRDSGGNYHVRCGGRHHRTDYRGAICDGVGYLRSGI
jgi:predicted PurR-regulated permease PerM